MRIRIRLDVRKPIKRKKKITKRDGSEFVVTCKYERLGEFCFICGMVTHTDRFCRVIGANGEVGGEKEWGSWLSAPPRRVASQMQSRWLREEDDDTWNHRSGGGSNEQHQSRGENSKKGKEVIVGRNYRDIVEQRIRVVDGNSNSLTTAINQGFTTNINKLYEINEDEETGLQLEERKRRRGEIVMNQGSDVEVNLTVLLFLVGI